MTMIQASGVGRPGSGTAPSCLRMNKQMARAIIANCNIKILLAAPEDDTELGILPLPRDMAGEVEDDGEDDQGDA